MSHEVLLDQFARDVEQGRLRILDVALAKFLAEQDPSMSDPLLWLTALLSRQLADGNLCLDLEQLSVMCDEQDWPGHWRQQQRAVEGSLERLAASTLVADGTSGMPANTPLVLDGTRLYLRRYWNHERVVASAIRQRLAQSRPLSASLDRELDRLFPPAVMSETDLPNWPKIACALAARGGFTVITGGPGTGKTTTVVRLLGLLQTLQLREHNQSLRIRLAAPTGKAAARLNASIAAQIAELDVDETTRAAIPAEVTTLHRLLGARPDTRRFRHNHVNPLHLDVLVIDEASMIDLEMMSAVLAALPSAARLILLGDKDQLSSVEAGAVLGDLCRRADDGHYSVATAQWLRVTTGDDIRPLVRGDAQPLDQQLAMLRHSHRFGDDSGIGQLARAVNAGDTRRVHSMLDAPSVDLGWLPSASREQLAEMAIQGDLGQFALGETATKPAGYSHYLELIQRERPTHDDAEANDQWAREVLQAFNHFQLLCALRHGPCGVDGLNQLIAESLHARKLIETSVGWYEGRPVMVTRNDYSLGLANGDVGICLRMPDDSGKRNLAVVFLADGAAGPSGTRIRRVPPSRLGEVNTVYAMTVHKSQGSEFEHTALVLPAQASNALTRELLYTGITRARHWFSLLGSRDIVDGAIERRTHRYSGLAERLADK